MNSPNQSNTLDSEETVSPGLSSYRIFRLTQGVKYINLSFVILLATIVLLVALGDVIGPKIGNPLSVIAMIFILILGSLGLVYSLIGIGSKRTSILLCIIGMFIAPINLAIIIIVLRKSTKLLTESGYKVGLLGVKK